MTRRQTSSAIGPNFDAVGGSADLREIVGALLTFGLLISVLMLVVCSACWAIASAAGSWQTATRAKVGLLVALGGAVLLGGLLIWANWLLDLGASL
ncbi:hypothetical protein FXB39_07860 [Nocardioides sp. BGMRC 2183]|nr:hypothetical protein FXB39_07860 [Nocardioides sp. BGMRC 2183]